MFEVCMIDLASAVKAFIHLSIVLILEQIRDNLIENKCILLVAFSQHNNLVKTMKPNKAYINYVSLYLKKKQACH